MSFLIVDYEAVVSNPMAKKDDDLVHSKTLQQQATASVFSILASLMKEQNLDEFLSKQPTLEDCILIMVYVSLEI